MTAPALPAQVVAEIDARRQTAHVIALAEFHAEVAAIFADRDRAAANAGEKR